ncbi:MAG: helix-turn-helix transcriptional regulator [Pseudomonadota bacterium]
MPSAVNAASDIDRRVGERIRRRRILLGFTQDQLGDALNISYQQVQKYETGANRVSAGRLHQIAQTLETNVGWFFDAISEDEQTDQTSSRHVIDLVRNFSRIEDEQVRGAVLSLVRSLATGDEETASAGLPAQNGNGTHTAGNGLTSQDI